MPVTRRYTTKTTAGPPGPVIRFRRYFFLPTLLVVILILSIFPATTYARPQPEVGYGPNFDACGDNCQTQLLHFCTQGRDAQQQRSCWCGEDKDVVTGFIEKMDSCLSSCDPRVTDTIVQRNSILRYKKVVCTGSTEEDKEFQEYYETRFRGEYVPMVTDAAPPPPLPTTIDVITLKPSPTARPTTEESSSTPEPTTKLPSSVATAEPTTSKTSANPFPVPTEGGPEDAKEDELPGHLGIAQVAGISVGAFVGFSLLSVLVVVIWRHQLDKKNGRSSSTLPFTKQHFSDSHSGFSPVEPVRGQLRYCPEGHCNEPLTGLARIKHTIRTLPLFKAADAPFEHHHSRWSRGEKYASNNPPPVIQLTPAPARKVSLFRKNTVQRNLSISRPIMAGASIGTGMSASNESLPSSVTVHDAVIAPEPPAPVRRDVILPPIPEPASAYPHDEVPHALTTPSGYSTADPSFFAYYGIGQPQRPESHMTDMTDCSSEFLYSNSEWTDYEERSYEENTWPGRSASPSEREIARLVEEVGRRNQEMGQYHSQESLHLPYVPR